MELVACAWWDIHWSTMLVYPLPMFLLISILFPTPAMEETMETTTMETMEAMEALTLSAKAWINILMEQPAFAFPTITSSVAYALFKLPYPALRGPLTMDWESAFVRRQTLALSTTLASRSPTAPSTKYGTEPVAIVILQGSPWPIINASQGVQQGLSGNKECACLFVDSIRPTTQWSRNVCVFLALG